MKNILIRKYAVSSTNDVIGKKYHLSFLNGLHRMGTYRDVKFITEKGTSQLWL